MLGESLTDPGGSSGRKENAPPFRKAADISQFLATPWKRHHYRIITKSLHRWLLVQDIQLFINISKGLLPPPQLIEMVLFLEMKIIEKTGKGRGLVQLGCFAKVMEPLCLLRTQVVSIRSSPPPPNISS